MRTVIVISVLLLAAAARGEKEVHPALQEARGRLESVLKGLQPEATVGVENGRVLARYRTRTFQVHSPLKTGDHAVELREIEGPDHKGFRLELSVVGPRFPRLTAMVYPQTMREPYWSTHHRLFPIRDGDSFIKLRLSYGSRCDEELMDRLVECLGPAQRNPDRPERRGIAVYMGERYVEGRPIRLSLGFDPARAMPPAELRSAEARLSVHLVREGPTPEHMGLRPVLWRILFPPMTRVPIRTDPLDLTSDCWIETGVRRGEGRFQPSPGKYRLTVTLSVPDGRPLTRLPVPRAHLLWKSNTVEFEVIPASGAKEDR